MLDQDSIRHRYGMSLGSIISRGGKADRFVTRQSTHAHSSATAELCHLFLPPTWMCPDRDYVATDSVTPAGKPKYLSHIFGCEKQAAGV